MTGDKNGLFSEKVAAGGRTYFFDVKRTKENKPYLVICESRPKDGGFEHQRVMVFPENFAAFGAALQKAAGYMNEETR